MKNSLLKTLTLSLTLAVFGGYSAVASASLSSKAATPSQLALQESKRIAAQYSSPADDSVQVSGGASQKVLSVYRQWAGTRYRLGGTSKSGIDCSAFVQHTMGKAFNVSLPRATAQQRHSGKAISKSDLRPGDLVFFRKNNHVGVYIGGGKFVHASSSQGVTTSSLSNSYWSRNYTQSRRVL